jgi:peptide/nickel transport system ATP-binding protein
VALLEVEDLVMRYRVPGGAVDAVSHVSFQLAEGETLALVGESGCGKSTTGKSILRLPAPTSGSIRLDGSELIGADRTAGLPIQMIFQDARSSLNPRRRVRHIVGEGLTIAGVPETETRNRVHEALTNVGIDVSLMGDRYPHEFSGGQCQRIAIARALVMNPKIIICDEPVASLDVSVQAQVINLLQDMKARYGLSMIFISHDLSVVRNLADRVAVMYMGEIVEIGDADRIYQDPQHPYTKALLESVPVPDAGRPSQGKALSGEPPSPLNPPSGCRFHSRCPIATELCAESPPELRQLGDGRSAACHFAEVTPIGIPISQGGQS